MSILIVAATAFEIAPLLDGLKKDPDTTNSWDIVITGVGLMAATYSIQKQLSLKRPDLIIQAGIAGSFQPDDQPGEVRVISADCIGDQGVLENGKFQTLVDMKFQDANHFPFKNGKLNNPDKSLIKKTGLKNATAITVNQISTNPSMIDLLKEKHGADIESMEGAALHYVGLMEKIPFVQLRAISNYVGERDKSKWKIKEAINQLNVKLLQLLKIF